MLNERMDFDRLRASFWSLEEGGIRLRHSAFAAHSRRHKNVAGVEDQVGAQLMIAAPDRCDPRPPARGSVSTHAEILQAADRSTRPVLGPALTRQALRLGISRSLLCTSRIHVFVSPGPPLSETDFVVRSVGARASIDDLFAANRGAILCCRTHGNMTCFVAPRLSGASGSSSSGQEIPQAPSRITRHSRELGSRSWLLNPDGCGFRHALAKFARQGWSRALYPIRS